MSAETGTLFEAEALCAVERAADFAKATESALSEAANALLRTSSAGYRDLEKVRELHRLATARLEVFARRLTEGPLTDDTSGETP